MLDSEVLWLTNTKPQVHENRQILYRAGPRLPQTLDQDVSDPEGSLSAVHNKTDVNSGLSAGTIYQNDAPSDLKVVSWAPRVPFGKTKSYAYDPGSGQSVIYLIENGVDGSNRVNT